MVASLPSCALGFAAHTAGRAVPSNLARLGLCGHHSVGVRGAPAATRVALTMAGFRTLPMGDTHTQRVVRGRAWFGRDSSAGALLSTKSDVPATVASSTVTAAGEVPDAAAAQVEVKGKEKGGGGGKAKGKGSGGGRGKKTGGTPAEDTPVAELRMVSGDRIFSMNRNARSRNGVR